MDRARCVRVGVIGLGNMGRAHARVYREMPDVELVGLADPLLPGDGPGPALTGVRTFRSHAELLAESLDAVTVAAPTELHHAVALDCLRAGVAVLIEKPIASTLEEALAIADAARAAGRVLMVGHIERFNPAAVALKERLAGQRLVSLRFQRSGPFPPRMSRIGIILDSAIHDIDLARWLTGRDAADLHCVSGSVHAEREDVAEILMRMEGGVIARITADWLSPNRTRTIEAHTADRRYLVDLIRGQLTEIGAGSEPGRYVVAELPVRRDESLRRELDSFVTAVGSGEPAPVTAEEGIRNLEIALRCIAMGEAARR